MQASSSSGFDRRLFAQRQKLLPRHVKFHAMKDDDPSYRFPRIKIFLHNGHACLLQAFVNYSRSH
jgi:hypothetical protein